VNIPEELAGKFLRLVAMPRMSGRLDVGDAL
jgi:hypothetical protein